MIIQFYYTHTDNSRAYVQWCNIVWVRVGGLAHTQFRGAVGMDSGGETDFNRGHNEA
jgi:hypothetical protein